MDPINTNDEEINRTRIEVSKILKNFEQIKSFHDFRIVGEGEHKNLIFDVVIDFSSKFTHEDGENLKSNIYEEIKKLHPKYNAFINIDREYA
jgi:divalent metal cation (Fe/Co/Zn/Cd) transporter